MLTVKARCHEGMNWSKWNEIAIIIYGVGSEGAARAVHTPLCICDRTSGASSDGIVCRTSVERGCGVSARTRVVFLVPPMLGRFEDGCGYKHESRPQRMSKRREKPRNPSLTWASSRVQACDAPIFESLWRVLFDRYSTRLLLAEREHSLFLFSSTPSLTSISLIPGAHFAVEPYYP
jgi:hypothetical protein